MSVGFISKIHGTPNLNYGNIVEIYRRDITLLTYYILWTMLVVQ